MTTPRHLELFIRDGKTAAQCRTETNGRLDDPVSIVVAGPEWAAFVADFGQTQAEEIDSLTTERDAAVASLETQRATMQAEIDRLTLLLPSPVESYMITPAEFVARLEAASPGIIDRLWASDTKEAGRLAVTLFTWTTLIDCRPGGRLEGYLQTLVALGFMDSDAITKVWV